MHLNALAITFILCEAYIPGAINKYRLIEVQCEKVAGKPIQTALTRSTGQVTQNIRKVLLPAGEWDGWRRQAEGRSRPLGLRGGWGGVGSRLMESDKMLVTSCLRLEQQNNIRLLHGDMGVNLRWWW